MRRPIPRRPGFTLVELLVVIVILAILVALLVPAITGAVRTANDARVVAEINTMVQALADFKTKYNDYPPSRILLEETGNIPTTGAAKLSYANAGPVTDISVAALGQRSLRYLRKFWPRVSLPVASGFYDFNGDGVNASANAVNPYLLQGDECLTWFLGGVPSKTLVNGVTKYTMTGFGKNPVNPWPVGGPGSSAQAPTFQFKSDRLVDLEGDGIPSYIDPLSDPTEPRYYAYFSSYGNGAYDPNDCNWPPVSGPSGLGPEMNEEDPNGSPKAVSRVFQVTFPVVGMQSGWSAPTGVYFDNSPPPNPYTSGPPVTGGKPVAYINPETFQIISAGRDGLYGAGGIFNNTGDDHLPLTDPTNTAKYHDQTSSITINVRYTERDNLTNFHNTKLD